jgi:hypothetical protein
VRMGTFWGHMSDFWPIIYHFAEYNGIRLKYWVAGTSGNCLLESTFYS